MNNICAHTFILVGHKLYMQVTRRMYECTRKIPMSVTISWPNTKVNGSHSAPCK